MKKKMIIMSAAILFAGITQSCKSTVVQNSNEGTGQGTTSDKYSEIMKKNIVLLDSAKTTADYIAVSSAFERIGDAEKTKWLPYYYAALAQTRIGLGPDKAVDKDAVAAKARDLATKGEAIEKNSELSAIFSMASTIQMLVDPMSRWQTYGPQAAKALEDGMQLNPKNPRLYFLQGSTVLRTPEFLGGGKAKAKPILEKALKLFNEEKVEALSPHWGKDGTNALLEECK
jgi:hypothetical protein